MDDFTELDIYVVVAERDNYVNDEGPYQPIVFETHVEGATLEKAKERIAHLKGRYGKTSIAKLCFVNNDY